MYTTQQPQSLNMHQIIRELESDNSRLAKEAILSREAAANNQVLFDGIRLALDNLISFGVKKVPMHDGPDGQGLSWEEFTELCTLLYTRKLTGHAARDKIEAALKSSTQDQWNYWYRRILIKDLRCGVSEKTVNKILKGTSIPKVPVFECMLAASSADKELTGKKLLEPKLDGVRCITVINYENRTVEQYTRNGKLLENFSHITSALEKHIDDFGRSYVLDGEIISTSFQALMKQVHRKDNVNANDAVLMLFDILPLSEFQRGNSVMGQKRRSASLKTFKHIFDQTGSIGIIPQIEIDLDSYVGQLEFKEYNKQAIKDGYEGIMIKDLDAVYECKRCDSWLKLKPFIEVSLKIVGLEEGSNKNEGTLGAFVCEGEDDGKFIRANAAFRTGQQTGLSEEERNEIWANPSLVLGQVVEIRADAITKSEGSDDVYSLRFPRFLRFRGFSSGEKI